MPAQIVKVLERHVARAFPVICTSTEGLAVLIILIIATRVLPKITEKVVNTSFVPKITNRGQILKGPSVSASSSQGSREKIVNAFTSRDY